MHTATKSDAQSLQGEKAHVQHHTSEGRKRKEARKEGRQKGGERGKEEGKEGRKCQLQTCTYQERCQQLNSKGNCHQPPRRLNPVSVQM